MKAATPGVVGWIERHERIIIAAMLLALLTGGLLYSVKLGNALRFDDERDFYAIAQNLAGGRGYSLDGAHATAFRSPGYPLLLAPIVRMGAHVFALRMLNMLFLAGALVTMFLLVRRMRGSLAGMLTVVLSLLYPVTFFTASTLYAQTLGVFLLSLVLYIAAGTRADRPGGLLLPSAISGVLLGWLGLTIPGMIPTAFVVAGWSLFARREHPLRRRLLASTVMAILAMAVMLCWTYRNYRVFGRAIPITSNTGLNLLLGNSTLATPNSGPGTDISDYLPGAEGLDEVGRDDYFRSQALNWIGTHKGQTARLYGLKILNWFNYRNDLAQKSEGSKARDVAMLLTFGPLLLLFGLRFALARRFRVNRYELLVVLLYATNAFAYAVFFTRIRFRLPFDIAMVSVVAIFVDNLIRGSRLPPDAPSDRASAPRGLLQRRATCRRP